MIAPGFTLCFLLYEDQVLMLHRRFPPNQGLWNGVGGHVEPGETPRQAVIREVFEETGYRIERPQFAGYLTWDGFEIEPGAIAIFTAEVESPDFITNHEGELAWKPKDWACSSPDVVDNIHVFLPEILAGKPPQHFHFSYLDGVRVQDQILELPADFDLEKPYYPEIDLLEEQRGDFMLSTDKSRLQINVIHDFIANQSYWAKGQTLDVTERSIQHSVCFGIYKLGQQVGFARLVTDEATFAWLSDVFVLEAERGQGLGKWLVDAVCRYLDQRGVNRTLLATQDAQSFYETYGRFEILDVEGKWMRRKKPGSGW